MTRTNREQRDPLGIKSGMVSVLPFHFDDPVRIRHDTHSPRMRIGEFLVKPTGIEVRVYWAHEGSIKHEWVPSHLLEVDDDSRR